MQRTDTHDTPRMDVSDLTMIQPTQDGGMATTTAAYPAQSVSPTYLLRPGWSTTDLELQRITHRDMARQRATMAAWQRGYITGVCMVLLTWIVWTLVSY